MKMTGKTRREMSDLINMVLGTSIDYSKLSKQDLMALYNKCQDPRGLIVQIGATMAQHRIGQVAGELLGSFVQGAQQPPG